MDSFEKERDQTNAATGMSADFEQSLEKVTTGQWMQRTYLKLRKIAAVKMKAEDSSNTLSATSLVHEVFVRLRTRSQPDCISERQFMRIVVTEMKRVLIDAARHKKSAKRGGGFSRQGLQEGLASEHVADSIVELNEAIDEFEKIDPQKAEIVRLRYFLGLSEDETAKTLGISRATASRHWAFARAWLLDYLSD